MGWYLLVGAVVVLVVGNFLPEWVTGDAAYVAGLVLTFIVAPALAITGVVVLLKGRRRA